MALRPLSPPQSLCSGPLDLLPAPPLTPGTWHAFSSRHSQKAGIAQDARQPTLGRERRRNESSCLSLEGSLVNYLGLRPPARLLGSSLALLVNPQVARIDRKVSGCEQL